MTAITVSLVLGACAGQDAAPGTSAKSRGGAGGEEVGSQAGGGATGGAGPVAGAGGTRGSGDKRDAGTQGGAAGGNPCGARGEKPASSPKGTDKGVISVWHFDEGKGHEIIDAADGKNDLFLHQGTGAKAPAAANPNWTDGKLGMGLRLDGKTQWLLAEASTSIDETGFNRALSVTAWIKVHPDERIGQHIIVERRATAEKGYLFQLSLSGDRPRGRIGAFVFQSKEGVPKEEWTHLALTYDGLTGKLYVNGEQKAVNESGWPITVDSTPVSIGAGFFEGEVTDHLSATLDEIRLYSRALEADEVSRLFKAEPAMDECPKP